MIMTAAITCLALNVYHEARNEPMNGMYAVASVVINRVQDDRWPNNVCAVVKDGYRKDSHKCQFSWYCDGKSDRPKEDRAWAMAVLVADDILRGTVDDVSHGATHYHANYVKPIWAKKLTRTVSYGSHIFYK